MNNWTRVGVSEPRALSKFPPSAIQLPEAERGPWIS